MKISGTLRSLPGGSGVAGITVSVKRHNGDTPVGETTTDPNGRWEVTYPGNPGPYYWEAHDPAGSAPDVTRKGSSLSYGSGGCYSLAELPYALRLRGNGVVPGYLGGLAVTPGGGLNLNVAAGAVVALGVPAVWENPLVYAVDPAQRDATHPRMCYLVALVVGPDNPTDAGLARIGVIPGTPAASPVLPDITTYQTEGAWNVPLASFRLSSAATSVIDQLVQITSNPAANHPTVIKIVRRLDPAASVPVSSSGVDVSGLTTTVDLLPGVAYDLSGRVWLVCNANSASTPIEVASYLNTSANTSEFLPNASLTPVGVGNAHATVDPIVGAGVPIACGARVKGVGSYSVGYFQVIARPRW